MHPGVCGARSASVVPVGDYNCRIVTMEAKTCFFRDEGTPWLCQTCVLGCNHAYLQVVVGRMGAGGHYPGNRHGVPTPDCNMVHVAHAYHALCRHGMPISSMHRLGRQAFLWGPCNSHQWRLRHQVQYAQRPRCTKQRNRHGVPTGNRAYDSEPKTLCIQPDP